MHRKPMLWYLFLILVATVATTTTAVAQQADTPTASELIDRSIAYHDPEGAWGQESYRLVIVGTRPIAGPTSTTIIIDNIAGRFSMTRERFGNVIESTVTGEDCWTRLNGSSDLTEQQIKRFDLGCEQMRWQRNYHTYLYGLPMKLRDSGAVIDPQVVRTEFNAAPVLQVGVTYEPEVGGDTWYFYFDPESAALVGYRFYHDESANDGEYIVLDREAQGGGVRLPKVRSWYRNADDELLGTDTIRSIERISRQR